jgi:hypothetical protein
MMRRQVGFPVGLALAGCLLGSLAAAVDQVQAAPVSQMGPITKFTSVDEIVEACTNSTTFVNMPSMSRTFTLASSSSDQVVVTFQAAASLSGEEPFDTGYIRLTIDGTAQGPGDGLIPLIGQGERGTHGFTWQSKTLAVGSRTARVQWRTDLGSTFCVDARCLVVLHK